MSSSQIFLDSILAPFRPFAVFNRLSRSPAPPLRPLFLNWWMWNFLTNILLAAWRAVAQGGAVPNSFLDFALSFGLWGALALASALIGAFVLHMIFLLCGGTGGFARSCQIGSILAIINPVSASLRVLNLRWAAVVLAASAVFLFVAACERLHKTPPLRGRIVWSLIAVLIAHVAFFSGRKRAGIPGAQSVGRAEPQAGKHSWTRSGPGLGLGMELKLL